MPNKDFFPRLFPLREKKNREKKWRAFFSSPLKRPIFCFIYFQTMNTKTTISPSKLIFFFCGSIFLPPRSHNFYAAFPQVSFQFLRVYEIKKLKKKIPLTSMCMWWPQSYEKNFFFYLGFNVSLFCIVLILFFLVILFIVSFLSFQK